MRILGTITTLRSQAERVEAYTRAAGGEVLAGGHRELHVRLACSTSDTTHLQQHPDGALTAVDTHGPPIGPHLSASVAELTGLYLSGRWEQIAQSQQTIVIWDPGEGRLALIRDRLGVPPLFYSQDDHGITWSTEIRPLVELGASADPDLVALAGFQLTGFVMHPRTSVAGVSRVPAAHWLSTDGSDVEIRRYWKPSPRRDFAVGSDAGASDSDVMETTLAASIEALADRGATTGTLLSGGVDSTAIAAVGAKVANVDLKTYTFRYSDYEGPMNETSAAELSAEALGLEHSNIVISAEYLMDALPRLIAAYEEPMSYGIHSARMGPIAEDGANVVLTGAEGAEWGLTPKMMQAISVSATVPRPVLTAMFGLVRNADTGYARRAKTFLGMAIADPAERNLHLGVNRLIQKDAVDAMLGNDDLTTGARHEIASAMASSLDDAGVSDVGKVIQMGFGAFGAEHICTWTHRWARAAGLSARFPLMDPRWIDLMASRHEKDSKKLTLRAVVRRHLPDDVTVGEKYPQALPLSDWFRGPMSSFLESKLRRDRVEADGTFDAGVVAAFLRDHLAGTADRRWELWSALVFLEWRDVVRTWEWDAPSRPAT